MVNTVNDVVEVLKGARVDKEGRDEVNLVVSSELVYELGLPAIDGGAGAERASISSKSGGKYIAIVLQLIGVIGITSDVVTERSGVIRG